MFAAIPVGHDLCLPARHRADGWDQSEKKQVQNRRRFYLLGQTLEAMQV